MHPIEIGSCGWSYKEWVGPLYPKGTAAAGYLAEYAQRFPVVEVDSTFYRSPSPSMVGAWRDRTPASFGFCLKVPRSITHEKMMLDCKGEVETFVSAARLLGSKLRCCLLQFGYINRAMLPDRQAFLDRLDALLSCWPGDLPLAVELRNNSWVNAAWTDWLRQRKIVWALTDQEWMQPPLDLVRKLDVVTGPFAYVRLLGVRSEVEAHTKQFDRIVVDRALQVQANADAIQRLRERVPVVVFVNNHFAGYAPATIRQLRETLGIA